MALTRYSDREKLAICADWALLGDDKLVADKHGVKLGTLKKWRREAWFKEALSNMHNQNSQRLIAKANRAMDMALDELGERIELGDMRCVLKGESVVSYREPVKARDLSAIVNVLATRSEKAIALASQTTQSYALADLQTSFRQFAKSYRAETSTINGAVDGEFTASNRSSIDHGINGNTKNITRHQNTEQEQDSTTRAEIEDGGGLHNPHSDHLKSLS